MIGRSGARQALPVRPQRLLTVTLLGAGCLVPASASGADAHVHGEAVLEVSVSASGLLVVLRGPAQVFYGFEHPPSTPEEAAVIRQAVALLRTPGDGVLAVDAGCVVEQVTLDAPFAREARDWGSDAAGTANADQKDRVHHEDHVHHEGHEGGDHEEEEDHEDHEGGEEESHDRHAHGAHADLDAQYVYRCSDTPYRLTIDAFARFPALEYVEAAWISDTAAGSQRLTPASPGLDFARR